MKNIVDIYGRNFDIEETTQKAVKFSNKERKIQYNAQIIENGKLSNFWTNYTTDGIINDIDIKINIHGNLNLIYAELVEYNATKNDKNKKIWNKLKSFVQQNEKIFFDEYGDCKYDIPISIDEIRDILNNGDGKDYYTTEN